MGDLGKLIVAKCFESCPKRNKSSPNLVTLLPTFKDSTLRPPPDVKRAQWGIVAFQKVMPFYFMIWQNHFLSR